jgi:hypothetical protein
MIHKRDINNFVDNIIYKKNKRNVKGYLETSQIQEYLNTEKEYLQLINKLCSEATKHVHKGQDIQKFQGNCEKIKICINFICLDKKMKDKTFAYFDEQMTGRIKAILDVSPFAFKIPKKQAREILLNI